MILVTLLLFVSACLICGILQAIIGDKKDWRSYLVSSLTSFLLFVFAVIIANISGIINAYSLLIIIAFGFFIILNLTKFVELENKYAKELIHEVLKITFIAFLAFSSLALATFSPFALVGGLLFGIGIGLLVWGIKKYKDVTTPIMTIIFFAFLGLFLVLNVNNVIFSTHLISSITMLSGSAILFSCQLANLFAKDSKSKYITITILQIIAYILIVGGIYFFI